jgi:transposase
MEQNSSNEAEVRAKARRRAELIMAVRTGKMTATRAAEELGVSRKTWYEWEERGLEAMVMALEDRPPGRPRAMPPDPEKVRLEDENRDLRQRLERSEAISKIRELMQDCRLPQGTEATAKKKPNGPLKP